MWLEFGNLKCLKVFFFEETSSRKVCGTQSIQFKANFQAYLKKWFVRFQDAFSCSVYIQWQV